MQEVIGSTPIFSTQTLNVPGVQLFSNTPGTNSAKTLPQTANFGGMESAEVTYTTPRLFKGKPVDLVPKGSTKAREEAKQSWYVEFFFYDPGTGEMERFRFSKNLNRIKEPKEKLDLFTELLDTYKAALDGGWSPIDERSNEKLKREIVSLTLDKAKELFEVYHKAKGTRKKSIQCYLSKVNAFINFYGTHKKVNEISDYEITYFLNHQEQTEKWLGVTYNNSRIALNNYFKYLKKNKYIEINPVTDTETRTKIATESHQVFSDDDFKTIMDWLQANDPYTLLFVRMIYYTCIRPKELRYLKLKYINLESNTITIPASIAKNKKALPVHIDPSLRIELDKLNIANYSGEHFLLGSPLTFISEIRIGENTPYYRFVNCLKKVKLRNKNYTLYSFKHFSNVKKFKAGWTIAEICAANRHSSLVETETYLKDLLKFVQTDKLIPAI
jgi:integrase